MAKDAFDETLAEFTRWTKTARKRLTGSQDDDVEEMHLLLDLMRDYLDIDDPADLSGRDLEELLLRVYPRKVAVEDASETATTIPAMQDFIRFLTESGQVPKAKAAPLRTKLTEIAGRFEETMMNPANRGMARSIATAMAADSRLPAAGFAEDIDDDFGDDEDGIDLKEAFGLPDELPPVLLPSDAELVATIRELPVIGRLRALAGWLGENGRPVDDDWDLMPADVPAAAAAAGVDPADLPYLWDLACETDFAVEAEDDEDIAVAGESALGYEDFDDDEILDLWDHVLAAVVGGTLDVAADLDPERSADLNLTGHGIFLLITLFMGGGVVPVAEASEVVRETATDGLPPAEAERVWREWVSAHGDPMRLLLTWLASTGVIRLTDEPDADEMIVLTPLGRYGARGVLIECGVDVPVFPDVAEMTAADVLEMGMAATEEEFDAAYGEWVGGRTPEGAARELLAQAAEASPQERMLAATVVGELGAAAEPAWRDCLALPPLSGYAKIALAQIARQDMPDSFTLEDAAWLAVDALVASGLDDVSIEHDPAEVAQVVGAFVPSGEELGVFERMARVDHPQAAVVLAVIGRNHPDRTLGKAARKAAYKAGSRSRAR
jgi:hypothetical protein